MLYSLFFFINNLVKYLEILNEVSIDNTEAENPEENLVKSHPKVLNILNNLSIEMRGVWWGSWRISLHKGE